MKLRSTLFTLLATGVAFASSASADEVYRARLSAQDHQSSSGTKLTDAAAILRQDRAIWHEIGGADDEDQADDFFSKKSNRAAFERLLNTGMIGDAEERAIVNGTPLVQVTISYDAGMKQHFVAVKVLEKGGTSTRRKQVEETSTEGTITKAAAIAAVRKAGYLDDNERVISAEHVPDKGIWVIYAKVEGDPNVRYQLSDDDDSGSTVVRTSE